MKKYIHTTLKGTLTAVVMMASVSVWAQEPDPTPTNVAKIGDTPYATLQEAITAASDVETTIQLINGFDAGTETYSISKTITLDLNGKTITASHSSDQSNLFEITSSGKLTVIGNGTITDVNVKGIFNNSGQLTIENGLFTTTSSDGYAVIFNTGSSANCNVNGGSFTGAYAAVYNADNATMTISNGSLTATSRVLVTQTNATLNITGGTISNESNVILARTGAKLNVTEGTITAPNTSNYQAIEVTDENTIATISGGTISGYNGISVWKKAALTVNDGAVISGTNTAISGNGTPGDGGTTIVINGGTITNNDDVAIYHPQDGTLTITGGTIKGTTALEVRSGTVSITGGKLTATASEYSCNPNGNGTTTVGAALAIAQHTTKKDISVNISGGTFSGVKAISESNPQENDPAPHVTMEVTDGTFDGDITTADVKKFISGGTFKKEVAAEYCAEGFVLEDLGGNYGVLYDMVLNDGANLSSFEEWNTKKVKATYTRNTGMVAADGTATKYGTICLPFEITAAIDGVKLYKATEINASTLTIIEVTDFTTAIPAGTPLIFELTNAATTMTVISKNATVNTGTITDPTDGNLLRGRYTATTITEGLGNIYYLNGDKFHQAKVSLSVPAYRAYLKTPTPPAGSARPTVISISHDGGDVTAITETEAWDTVSEVYDLNGRKQSGLQKGVNIMRRADGSSFRVIVK